MPKSILIADDDNFCLMTLSGMLKSFNVEIFPAKDG